MSVAFTNALLEELNYVWCPKNMPGHSFQVLKGGLCLIASTRKLKWIKNCTKIMVQVLD